MGAALSPPEQKDRRVEGIVIFASSNGVVNDVGVRQLGGLASELAKQAADKAQEQQDVVLKDAQQLNLDQPVPAAADRHLSRPRATPRTVLALSGSLLVL